MDIDAIVKQVPALLAFKAKMEALIPPHILEAADDPAKLAALRSGSIADPSQSSAPLTDIHALIGDVHALIAFKNEVQEFLPQMVKAVADIGTVVDDIAKLKEELGPALVTLAAIKHTPLAPDPDAANPSA